MPGHKLKRRLDRKSKARSPKPHPASASARAPEPMGDLSRIRELTPNAVVRLQSMIGNQAVQRLLYNGHPQLAITPRQLAPVQRWEGPEHAKLGNATGMTIDLGEGVVLDWGQVVAIAGDEIGTLEELQEAVKTPEGKARIRAALEHAEVPGNAAKTLPAPSDDQKKAQDSNYYTLLLDNLNHFQSGGMALDAWRSHHQRAIDAALATGLSNPFASTTTMNEAYLKEAFGQHFLTDMFSGGHLRTPRSEIADWYVGTFAPRVLNSALNSLKYRLIDGIYKQVAAQSWSARNFEGSARNKIKAGLDAMIKEKMAEAKIGYPELQEYFGKALAGVISGAIHDAEGKRGVQVNTLAHPEAFTALGDSQLDAPDNATNKAQGMEAVKAGLADVNRAYEIGQKEGAFKQTAPQPDRLPSTVYFKFNSTNVTGGAPGALDQAAAYLAYNPDAHVELTGHTDPVGSDSFNDDLGTRRAEAVASSILGHAVPPTQVSKTTMGEKQLATTNPKKYALDRRVEFAWTSQGVAPGMMTDADQIGMQRALDAAKAELGPPYMNVEQYIPQEIAGDNPELPDWHWDTMSPELRQNVNDWVHSRFTKMLQEKILNDDMLKEQEIEGNKINPRPIVKEMLDEINKDPMNFLDSLFGDAAYPDRAPDTDDMDSQVD